MMRTRSELTLVFVHLHDQLVVSCCAGHTGILRRQLVRHPTVLGLYGVVQQPAEIVRHHHPPTASQKLAKPLISEHDTGKKGLEYRLEV